MKLCADVKITPAHFATRMQRWFIDRVLVLRVFFYDERHWK